MWKPPSRFERQAQRLMQKRFLELSDKCTVAQEEIASDVISRNVARSGFHAGLLAEEWTKLLRENSNELRTAIINLVDRHGGVPCPGGSGVIVVFEHKVEALEKWNDRFDR